MKRSLILALFLINIAVSASWDNMAQIILNKPSVFYDIENIPDLSSLEKRFKCKIVLYDKEGHIAIQSIFDSKRFFRSITTSLDIRSSFSNGSAAGDFWEWNKRKKELSKKDKKLFESMLKLTEELKSDFGSFAFYLDAPGLLRIEGSYPDIKSLKEAKKEISKMNETVKKYFAKASIPQSLEESLKDQPFIIEESVKPVNIDYKNHCVLLLETLKRFKTLYGLQKGDIESACGIYEPSYTVFYLPGNCSIFMDFIVENGKGGWKRIKNGFELHFEKGCPEIEVYR